MTHDPRQALKRAERYDRWLTSFLDEVKREHHTNEIEMMRLRRQVKKEAGNENRS